MDKEAAKIWDDLLEWANANEGSQFVIRHNRNCFETAWRVALWEKGEGASFGGQVAEGIGKTGREAVASALASWRDKSMLRRKTGSSFYLPKPVADILDAKDSG